MRSRYSQLWRNSSAKPPKPKWSTTTILPCASCRWIGMRIFSPERTGVFTSGLGWILQKLRIALYFTGCKHAGENLAEVLKLRSPELPPIIQMCDALSRNVPKIVETLVANCNAHGRRNFVKVTANFPEPCRFVLEIFREIYGYDAVTREHGMAAEERLPFHPEDR